MCIAIPGRLIKKLDDNKGIVDLGGVSKEVSLAFIPNAIEGDWIIIHTGFGLEIMSEKDALDMINILQEAYRLS